MANNSTTMSPEVEAAMAAFHLTPEGKAAFAKWQASLDAERARLQGQIEGVKFAPGQAQNWAPIPVPPPPPTGRDAYIHPADTSPGRKSLGGLGLTAAEAALGLSAEEAMSVRAAGGDPLAFAAAKAAHR